MADPTPQELLMERLRMHLLRLEGGFITDGAPTENDGQVGTWWLDKSTGDLYEKLVTGWGDPIKLFGASAFEVWQGLPGNAGKTVEEFFDALTGPPGGTGLTPNITALLNMIASGGTPTVTRSGPDATPTLTFNIPTPLDGAPGRELETQVDGGYWQVRYSGETEWSNLASISLFTGPPGPRGAAFTVSATGDDLAARDAYDGEDAGFSFVDTSTGLIYFRQTEEAGVWSDGIPFAQPSSDILNALDGLGAATGVLVKTGPTAFETRQLGAASDGDILTRLAADGLYRKASDSIAQSAVTGLTAALGEKADAGAVLASLGDKADKATTYTKAEVDGAIPVKASGAELRALSDDTKFLTPKDVADAAALVTLTDAATIAVDLAAGTNFVVTLGGNRTLGAPSNAKPGTSGTILIKQPASGGPRTLAYASAWMPFGATPALSTAASAVDLLTWIVETSSKVRFTLAKGGAA